MQHLYTSWISHCCPNRLQYLDVHRYYLTKDYAIQNDPSLKNYKVRIFIQDYAKYKNALPYPRVLNDYKQNLAIQQDE